MKAEEAWELTKEVREDMDEVDQIDIIRMDIDLAISEGEDYVMYNVKKLEPEVRKELVDDGYYIFPPFDYDTYITYMISWKPQNNKEEKGKVINIR